MSNSDFYYMSKTMDENYDKMVAELMYLPYFSSCCIGWAQNGIHEAVNVKLVMGTSDKVRKQVYEKYAAGFGGEYPLDVTVVDHVEKFRLC